MRPCRPVDEAVKPCGRRRNVVLEPRMDGQLRTAMLEPLGLHPTLRRLLLEPGALCVRARDAQLCRLVCVTCTLRRACRLEPRALAAPLLHARELLLRDARRFHRALTLVRRRMFFDLERRTRRGKLAQERGNRTRVRSQLVDLDLQPLDLEQLLRRTRVAALEIFGNREQGLHSAGSGT